MSTPTKPTRVSSPAATGGAGNVYEQHVAAYWLALLLVRGAPPIFRNSAVTCVHFQTERLGYHTDDFLVTVESAPGEQHQLLGQVKRSFAVSAADDDCTKTIVDCWRDFQDAARFSAVTDRIAIVTLRGTNVLLEHFVGLLETSRAASDAADFEHRLATPGFVHAKVGEYCAEVRCILERIEGNPVPLAAVWPFLKVLHLLNLDLASSTAQVEAHVKTLLAHTATEPDPRAAADATWNALVREVGDGMSLAKSYQLDTLPEALRRRHSPVRAGERNALSVSDPLREVIRNLPETLVRHLRPYLASEGSGPPLTRAQEAIGQQQARLWMERARKSLDFQGQRLWEDIRRDVRSPAL